MTQSDESMNGGSMIDENPPGEATLCTPWVVFASGQGHHEEYNTTASTGIVAALEEEVSALCREFHNALGVQEVPDGLPVVLFWKARQSSAQSSPWIVTQVLRTPEQSGERIAYEYFSLALTDDHLLTFGTPLRALEVVSVEELRERYITGLREPIYASVNSEPTTNSMSLMDASQFAQNGTWPATRNNREALLDYLGSAGTRRQTFATWWPGAQSPPPGVFDIVLRSEETRVAKPHEIVALATELNQSLSRSLPASPSYDSVGARYYRALLHNADEVQVMLTEAYSPAALEESPHRWMARPQKLAGLCQKIADDLPEYGVRISASSGTEMQRECAELADRYGHLARSLQKLRHPNMLQQSREPARGAALKDGAEAKLHSTSGSNRKGMPFALVLGGLLALCLFGFGVRTLVVGSNTGNSKAQLKANALSGNANGDQKAIALMRTRADRQVFQIARSLAAKRASGPALSEDAMQSIVVNAVAQAMLQTPHGQIKPAQKRLLFRMATARIRSKAQEGARAGIQAEAGQRNRIRRTR